MARGRKDQHPAIEANVLEEKTEAGHRRTERCQQAGDVQRQHEAGPTAQHRQQQGLGRELPGLAETGGAQRGPYGDFFLPGAGPRQQQAAHVGAGDQQQQSHGPQQSQDHLVVTLEDVIANRNRFEVPTLVTGVFFGEAMGQLVQPGMGLLQRDALSQPRGDHG